MASLIINKDNDTSRITWMDGKKHRTIHLGRASKTHRNEMKQRIESLVLSNKTGQPLSVSMAAWLESLTDEIHKKLSKAGLVAERQSQSLGGFLEAYRERRTQKMKPATMVVLNTITNDLFGFFKPDTPMRSITIAMAQDYETYMRSKLKGLRPYTVSRRMTAVKSIFAEAARLEIVPRNPFMHFKAACAEPKQQKHYVSVEDTQKILEHCSPHWKLIVALSRFAGLRCPTEVLSLKWDRVNLPAGRMVVHSPKTEHIPGKAERVVPIFALLRPHLEEAFEAAEDGAVYVVGGPHRDAANGPGGWKNCNLRTTLRKIIRRAGLAPWDDLYNSMRASCETDLCQEFPGHVVCEWIGHDALISRRHYTQVLESHFAKAAAQKTAQSVVPSEVFSGSQVPSNSADSAENVENALFSSHKDWTLRGSNYCEDSSGFAGGDRESGAKSGAIPVELVEAWPRLSENEKTAILAIAVQAVR